MGMYDYVAENLSNSWANDRTRLVLLSAAGVAGIAAAVHYARKKRYNLPPGPRPWPVIGNLYGLMTHKDPFQYFAEMQEKYGDMYTVYFGSTPMVVLGTAELMREAFMRQGGSASGRPKTFSLEVTSCGDKDIFSAQPNETWKLQRAIIHKAIRKFGSGKPMEDLMLDSFERIASVFEKEESAINPSRTLQLMFYNMFGNMVFGKRWELDDPALLEFVSKNDEIAELFSGGFLADFLPVFAYIPTKAVRDIKRLMHDLLGYLHETLKEHRETFEAERITDFTYSLIEMEQEVAKEEGGSFSKLTDEHLIMLMADLFFTGIDTSRFALEWIMLHMAMNQDVQKKLQEELDAVIGEGRRVSLADRDKLHYMNAVIHEVMRLKPSTPMGGTHVVTKDITLGGYELPVDTQIAANIIAIQSDPRQWEHPGQFKPERFLDERGKFVSKPGWVPFSVGDRTCVGQALAKTDLQMFVAAFFHRFSVLPPEDEELSFAHKPNFFFLMPVPFKIRIEARG